VWAYRKAAWAIEDLPVLSVGPREQDVGLIYHQMGPLREGLERIENVGPRLAAVIEHLLKEPLPGPVSCESPGLLRCGALPWADSST